MWREQLKSVQMSEIREEVLQPRESSYKNQIKIADSTRDQVSLDNQISQAMEFNLDEERLGQNGRGNDSHLIMMPDELTNTNSMNNSVHRIRNS